ncbi:hypothetical protein [Paenibacillus radicis (ex Xue et al. 2023)]|uniref:Uncharacterized protein n=1 Tax=Paenibacillus radicis (ex Xue et al. 2023) TaxID=2972489 RepID=A0ABT1YL53_9BACL|nr:hypothetical protein [Paenibacillus radicis (ex Xue et al. 2023)]MCR8633908.1 hypothetical protein [Paenibacillus radicis (ex Xue et al. 2023)]
MARRSKRSISTFLVSALGMLCMLKAFVWVLETKVLNTPIEIPFLNYGIMIAVALLLIRVSFVLLKHKARKSKVDVQEIGNGATTPNDIGTFHCADCGKKVSEKVRSYCLERPNKFNNQVFCYEHQR